MASRWYNPLSWRMFGYNDPATGEYIEVEMLAGGKRTKSGVTITSKTAMTIPIIWSCVKILSESAAGLPLKIFEDGPTGRVLADTKSRQARVLRKPNPHMTKLNFLKCAVVNMGLRGNGYSIIERADNGDWIGFIPVIFEDGPTGRVLADTKSRQARVLRKPNPHMTKLNFLKCAVVNMGLRGNGYSIIERADNGDWIGFIPVSADNVEVDTSDDLIYWVTLDGKRFPVSPENMLHFKLFSADGIIGLSPVEYMAESMGLAKTAQAWSARFMRKGGFTGGYVIYDQFLTKAQQTQIMEKFPDVRKGDVDDIGSMGILQGGPKIVPAGLSQKDSQFIESQQFQEEALAGCYGVPLYLANRAGKTSIMGSNLEQQTSGFVTFGLKPYLDAIEDEINDKLFRDKPQFVEFVVEGLLRADSAGRATYYQAALGGSGGSGWMCINEVRDKENLPRLEGEEYSRVTRWEMQTNAQQT